MDAEIIGKKAAKHPKDKCHCRRVPGRRRLLACVLHLQAACAHGSCQMAGRWPGLPSRRDVRISQAGGPVQPAGHSASSKNEPSQPTTHLQLHSAVAGYQGRGEHCPAAGACHSRSRAMSLPTSSSATAVAMHVCSELGCIALASASPVLLVGHCPPGCTAANRMKVMLPPTTLLLSPDQRAVLTG